MWFDSAFQAARKDARTDGARSERGRGARAEEERSGALVTIVVVWLLVMFSRLNTMLQLLEAEEMRKNELHRRVDELHKRCLLFAMRLNLYSLPTLSRLEQQREQRLAFERAEQQKLKQRGKPLCVAIHVLECVN